VAKKKGGGGKVAALVLGGLLVAHYMPTKGHHLLSSSAGAPSAAASHAVAFAQAHLGDPYVWGATGPGSFDCSGLTWDAYDGSIPRTSEAQWAALRHISAAHLRPGDLVFSYWNVDNQAAPNHVQIYVGGGDVIGADTTDVERTPLSTDAGHIVGFGRA
jgi:cell wall-associated NlpC family hydrolase